MLDNPEAEKTIQQYEQWDQEIPPSLICPEIYDVELSIWESFWELSTERQIGMSPGPIPVSKIIEHAERRSGVPKEALVSLIRIMDGEYLKQPDKGDATAVRNAQRGEKEDDGSRGTRPKGSSRRSRSGQ